MADLLKLIVGCLLLGALTRWLPGVLARWLLPIDAQPSAVLVLSMILSLAAIVGIIRWAE